MAKRKTTPPKEKIVLYTQEQLDFVDHYIAQRLKDATGAYQLAYPNCRTEGSAAANASKLIRTPKIQALLKQKLEEATGRRKEHLEHQILELWFTRAFYEPADILDDSGNLAKPMAELRRLGLSVCIEGVDKKPTKDGGYVKVYKLSNRDHALEQLQRYIAMIKPVPQVNLNLNKGAGDLSDDEEKLYRAQIDAIKGATK